MEIYLVGGAVRDQLLGLPVKDRDWVVVGSTPAEMSAAGYRPIGKDFPVFLHPESHEEYALARTERKSAPGYHGFNFHAEPEVTLEEDLRRRDLTINAIAQAADGSLIDPFDGQGDIERRELRHVSSAFAEDPVRLLRIARFLARFHLTGFTIADDTNAMMRSMVESGEADALVAERVWQEIEKTLNEPSPEQFFYALRDCDALNTIIPEIDALFGVPQPEQWHPEIDSGVHTMMTLQQACRLSVDPLVRFAALCHDLGKAKTPKDKLPSHPGHEEVGATITSELCQRLRVPGRYRDIAELVARYHTHVHRAQELSASRLTRLLGSFDVIRKPDRLELILLACEADARGRTGFEDRDYPQADFIREAAKIYTAVDAAAIARSVQDPKNTAEKIVQARVLAIKAWLHSTASG
ncbi:MAG: multifunctional CCA addition/repair protein [Gammaproteobacteria bacterium]|nr:multifunctional CCA addition/repair protein [Gammaproteobacteria bacterium]